MTSTQTTTPTVTGPSAGQLWRRLRAPLAVLTVVLLGALGIGLAQSGTVRGELDPRAVDPAGSRALAMLLSERGIAVRRVTDVDAALREGQGDTVLVAFPGLVEVDQLQRLADELGADTRLVLVGPDDRSLDAVTDDVRQVAEVDVTLRTPDCRAAPAITAGSVDLGGRAYEPAPGATGCYPDPRGATLVTARTRAGSQLVVLGDGAPLRNDRLAENGNAALSLLLLGADDSSDQVSWLMPVPGSAEDTSSAFGILPDWTVPVGGQLLLTALVVALWRARRLGPPVLERLPVIVRAAETVEGRGRLYRRAGARDRAAEALRAGALARLVPRLGLGSEPSAPAVVQAVGWRSGRRQRDVSMMLFGPPPPDDATLVRLADDLDLLVARTLGQPDQPATPRTDSPASDMPASDVEVPRS